MKAKTQIEKDYHDAVARIECVVSGCHAPSCVHHARFAAGMGQRSDHFLVAALCWDHHQGPNGIHADQKLFEMRYGSEEEMVARTVKGVFKLMQK